MSTGEQAEAHPRTAEEIESLSEHPDVVTEAQSRGINQVVHFTTLSGATGTLASRAVKSRRRLRRDQYLEHVYTPNARHRRDEQRVDYINLSIQRINEWMFQHSERWHAEEGNPWVILSFHPRILSHRGVVFTTTNNIYSTCQRAEGLDGFSRMFADMIVNYDGTVCDRTNKPAAWPTDRQAEVLYPGELSCTHLQRIDVQVEDSLDTISGILGALGMDVPVRHAPEGFE